jgi:hypothetical protein
VLRGRVEAIAEQLPGKRTFTTWPSSRSRSSERFVRNASRVKETYTRNGLRL